MKNLQLKSIIIIFLLSLNFAAFAEPVFGPASTAEGNSQDEGYVALESDDAAATPINGQLLWLALIGSGFAYYTYRKNSSTKTVN